MALVALKSFTHEKPKTSVNFFATVLNTKLTTFAYKQKLLNINVFPDFEMQKKFFGILQQKV